VKSPNYPETANLAFNFSAVKSDFEFRAPGTEPPTEGGSWVIIQGNNAILEETPSGPRLLQGKLPDWLQPQRPAGLHAPGPDGTARAVAARGGAAQPFRDAARPLARARRGAQLSCVPGAAPAARLTTLGNRLTVLGHASRCVLRSAEAPVPPDLSGRPTARLLIANQLETRSLRPSWRAAQCSGLANP